MPRYHGLGPTLVVGDLSEVKRLSPVESRLVVTTKQYMRESNRWWLRGAKRPDMEVNMQQRKHMAFGATTQHNTNAFILGLRRRPRTFYLRYWLIRYPCCFDQILVDLRPPIADIFTEPEGR